MKHQSLSGSLIARRTSLIQNKNNRNNNNNTQDNINNTNSFDNDNLTLTLNDDTINKSKINNNNIDNNNLLYKTPSNTSKNRNSLLNLPVQDKNNILRPNFTKSLDRGRTSCK